MFTDASEKIVAFFFRIEDIMFLLNVAGPSPD
jgi:hypothetical protein